MILVVFVVFDDTCLLPSVRALVTMGSPNATNSNLSTVVVGNATASQYVRNVRPGSSYPIALVSLFLWMGVFQVLKK
jgi:hypothetical protein